MAVAIGIWLALLGYTVAWAGWRNLGIAYSPQSDGSVIPSSPPVSLLDAFTCRSPQPATTNPAAPASPSSPTPPPTPAPNPVPTPRPGGIFAPIGVLQPAPRPTPLPVPGFPRPPTGVPRPGGLGGVLSSLEAGFRSLVDPILAGLHL